MGRDIEKAIDDGASQTSKESDAPGETQRSGHQRTTSCKRRWILGSVLLVIGLVIVAVVLGITLSHDKNGGDSMKSSNAVAATETESSQPKGEKLVDEDIDVPAAEEEKDSTPVDTSSSSNNPSSGADSTTAETKEEEVKTKDTSNKKSWPELVGVPVEDAVAVISEERPDLEIETIPHDFMYTEDYVTSRVRIFTKAGLVFKTPVIG